MATNNLLLPAIITGYRTLADSSIRITVDSGELPAETVQALHKLLKTPLQVYFSSGAIEPEQKEVLDGFVTTEMDVKTPKTPSQRLRATLYRAWEADNQGMDSDSYYKAKMEQIISDYKATI